MTTLLQQITRTRAELGLHLPKKKRRLPPRSPRRLELESRLCALMTRQMRAELRRERRKR